MKSAFKYKVTLVHFDPAKNFTYTVEADSPWDAFLKQPPRNVTGGNGCWKTWTVEELPLGRNRLN